MEKYMCVCGYEYDTAVGDPDGGIAPEGLLAVQDVQPPDRLLHQIIQPLPPDAGRLFLCHRPHSPPFLPAFVYIGRV